AQSGGNQRGPVCAGGQPRSTDPTADEQLCEQSPGAAVVMISLIIVVSGVGIFVSIYNSMSDRRREIAIMRALGARRGTVSSIIVAEAVLLCAGGGLVGLLLGHALVFVAGPIVEAKSDILIDPWF